MQVQVNNKKVNIPDSVIAQYVKSLDISEEEAVQMYLDDEGYTTNDQVEEMTKKAKVNKTDKVVAQSKVERKKVERKAPENPLKENIIAYLYDILSKNNTIYNIKVENKTKIITFMAENKQFKLDLVQKREKKA